MLSRRSPSSFRDARAELLSRYVIATFGIVLFLRSSIFGDELDDAKKVCATPLAVVNSAVDWEMLDKQDGMLLIVRIAPVPFFAPTLSGAKVEVPTTLTLLPNDIPTSSITIETEPSTAEKLRQWTRQLRQTCVSTDQPATAFRQSALLHNSSVYDQVREWIFRAVDPDCDAIPSGELASVPQMNICGFVIGVLKSTSDKTSWIIKVNRAVVYTTPSPFNCSFLKKHFLYPANAFENGESFECGHYDIHSDGSETFMQAFKQELLERFPTPQDSLQILMQGTSSQIKAINELCEDNVNQFVKSRLRHEWKPDRIRDELAGIVKDAKVADQLSKTVIRATGKQVISECRELLEGSADPMFHLIRANQLMMNVKKKVEPPVFEYYFNEIASEETIFAIDHSQVVLVEGSTALNFVQQLGESLFINESSTKPHEARVEEIKNFFRNFEAKARDVLPMAPIEPVDPLMPKPPQAVDLREKLPDILKKKLPEPEWNYINSTVPLQITLAQMSKESGRRMVLDTDPKLYAILWKVIKEIKEQQDAEMSAATEAHKQRVEQYRQRVQAGEFNNDPTYQRYLAASASFKKDLEAWNEKCAQLKREYGEKNSQVKQKWSVKRDVILAELADFKMLLPKIQTNVQSAKRRIEGNGSKPLSDAKKTVLLPLFRVRSEDHDQVGISQHMVSQIAGFENLHNVLSKPETNKEPSETPPNNSKMRKRR